MSKLKICLYSPYIPKHLGGGEMYLMQVAEALQEEYEVVVAVSQRWMDRNDTAATELAAVGVKDVSNQALQKRYEAFLGKSLKKVQFVSSPLGSSASIWEKLTWTKKWDIFYHLTDGSIIPSFAKRNILHIQFPFTHFSGSLWSRWKLRQFDVINTNSVFTKNVIEMHWPTKVDVVHHPYVDIPSPQPKLKKQKKIVHVGRFFRQLHSKRQDILVKAFRQLLDEHPKETKDWQLELIGSIEDESYANEVKELAQGLPITFYHQISRDDLLKHLAEAQIYWHATGFGVDEQLHPEKVEHFGISTIEAMCLGLVPVVINKGGQPEVVGDNLTSLLWNNLAELKEKTLRIITNNTQRKTYAQLAQDRAKVFNKERFTDQLMTMIQS